jgi:hypothetical protein
MGGAVDFDGHPLGPRSPQAQHRLAVGAQDRSVPRVAPRGPRHRRGVVGRRWGCGVHAVAGSPKR